MERLALDHELRWRAKTPIAARSIHAYIRTFPNPFEAKAALCVGSGVETVALEVGGQKLDACSGDAYASDGVDDLAIDGLGGGSAEGQKRNEEDGAQLRTWYVVDNPPTEAVRERWPKPLA